LLNNNYIFKLILCFSISGFSIVCYSSDPEDSRFDSLSAISKEYLNAECADCGSCSFLEGQDTEHGYTYASDEEYGAREFDQDDSRFDSLSAISEEYLNAGCAHSVCWPFLAGQQDTEVGYPYAENFESFFDEDDAKNSSINIDQTKLSEDQIDFLSKVNCIIQKQLNDQEDINLILAAILDNPKGLLINPIEFRRLRSIFESFSEKDRKIILEKIFFV